MDETKLLITPAKWVARFAAEEAQSGDDAEEPFALSIFNSARSKCNLPRVVEAPPEEPMTCRTDVETDAMLCINGLEVEPAHIEAYAAKSIAFRQEEQAHAVYFFDQMNAVRVADIKRMRKFVTTVRRVHQRCSMLKILISLAETGSVHYPTLVDTKIVVPRLAHLVSLLRIKDSPHYVALSQTDVDQISVEAYISLTTGMLGYIFAGGGRAVDFSAPLKANESPQPMNPAMIARRGHELWHFLHCAVPALDWRYRHVFAPLSGDFPRYLPHAYQYSDGHDFVAAVWCAFRVAITHTIGSCQQNIMSTRTADQLVAAVDSYQQRTRAAFTNVQEAMSCFLFAAACGIIHAEFPKPQEVGVAGFESVVKKFMLLSPISAYLTSCAIDIHAAEAAMPESINPHAPSPPPRAETNQ